MLPFVRSFACATLLGAFLVAVPARAADYTDLWFIPAESGWGVNVVQSDNFMFLTFFIYGMDGKPTWYTADLAWDGMAYSGGLYLTQGTYFPLPWNPANSSTQQVGTAQFLPNALNAYQATLTYTVNGVGTVVKAIERQSLTIIAIAGSYVGGQAGGYTSCSQSNQNGGYTDNFNLDVTQQTNGIATLTFDYSQAGATCVLSGPLEQHGQLYRIAGASYQCTGGLQYSTTATVYEFKATAQGIEGRLAATLPSSASPSSLANCQENANFSAVLVQ
jgi:hypothetical protein